jgi:hypothetical protein
MGGTVVDPRTRYELEGTHALGRLAEAMVFTLGRVIRKQPLLPEDQAALESAQRLFDLMADEDVVVIDVAGDRMLNDESYLEALHVVEHRGAEGEAVEQQAKRYAELLRKVARNERLSDDELRELAAMRELFSEVGEATLARASELSQPHQEPSWQLMRQTTSRF